MREHFSNVPVNSAQREIWENPVQHDEQGLKSEISTSVLTMFFFSRSRAIKPFSLGLITSGPRWLYPSNVFLARVSHPSCASAQREVGELGGQEVDAGSGILILPAGRSLSVESNLGYICPTHPPSISASTRYQSTTCMQGATSGSLLILCGVPCQLSSRHEDRIQECSTSQVRP